MTTALDKIVAYKKNEVAALRHARMVTDMMSEVSRQAAPRGFVEALTSVAETSENALICEMKRKSPSAGEILPGANPMAIARESAAGGAAWLSVLTDWPSFGGSAADFAAIRDVVSSRSLVTGAPTKASARRKRSR